VITNGWGKMNGYAAQVPAADRWAIVAYIRALQVSQDPAETMKANAAKENAAAPAAPTTHSGGAR
jgi:mono/diheme cytochrome c family protein